MEFNEGFTFLLGEDWSSKSVEIALYDSSRSTYGSNPILGGWKIGMRDLVRTISIIDMFSFPDMSKNPFLQVDNDLERVSRSLLGERSSHPEQTFTFSASLRFAAPSSDVS